MKKVSIITALVILLLILCFFFCLNFWDNYCEKSCKKICGCILIDEITITMREGQNYTFKLTGGKITNESLENKTR